MGSMDDVYGGNTLKAEDLPENFRGLVFVESVSVQEFENDKGNQERKLVLRFRGKAKGLALNITNANMMAMVAGSRDYDYWSGKQVVMYRTMTQFGNKMVPAIRLDHPSTYQAPPTQRPVPPPPPPPPPAGGDFQATDEDVPF